MSRVDYKIDVIWSDGVARPFPEWGEIHSFLLDRFGSPKSAYDCFRAYTRDREGYALSYQDQVFAVSWRVTLEELFTKISRPSCAVIIVRRIVHLEE